MYCKEKSTPSIDFEKNAEMWINLWKKQFDITDLNAPMSEKHKEERSSRAETLREMIQFCKERSLKPYIVLPPIHYALYSRLPMSFMKNYVYDFIEEAIGDELLILDYLKCGNSYENKCFKNSYFLNKKGALVLTNNILMRIM